MKIHSILLALCLVTQFVFAQTQSIKLINPSFEDPAQIGITPSGWYNCGFSDETLPDIHPNPFFSVSAQAIDGKTYLGMVVRDNHTWQAISQELSQPMQKDERYQLKIYLARSPTYWNRSRKTNRPANYSAPVKLRIFGGFNGCDGLQFLAETPLIAHSDWRPYVLQFEPALKAYDHLILEAYYDEAIAVPYNGNILIDHLSKLYLIDWPCPKEDHPYPKPEFIERPTVQKKMAEGEGMGALANNQNSVNLSIRRSPAKTKADLAQIVKTSAWEIAFTPSGEVERSHCTDDYTNKGKWLNLPLQNILEGLHQHPLATLVIAVAEEDPVLAEQKKQSLKEALLDLGGRQDQVIVRNWLEKDAEKTWIGDPASGVLLRLIR